MTYDEFEDTARDLFGLAPEEVADLAASMDAVGLPLEAIDVDDRMFWEIALDVADPYFEDVDVEERYPLDPRFPGDDYMDAGVEWELTAESIEGYGDD